MERKKAVFEHVPHKDTKSSQRKSTKRIKSPEPTYEDTTSSNVKRRKIGVRMVDEPLKLICEFNRNCEFKTEHYNDYLKHIDFHVNELVTFDEMECMFEGCSFKTTELYKIKQHMYYHAYHQKLKNIGRNLLERTKLPDCIEVMTYELPELPDYYNCEWDDCSMTLLDYQSFIDHIKCHTNANPKTVQNKTDNIKCLWQGCTNKYPTQYKLQDHVRTHTKERLVACPTCGFMFASKTKFNDHRKRQLAIDLQGYQCSQCSKLFASERLLRDHMRVHINHYKCHLCDMTCPKPSMLAKHIRYRHLPDRPYKCDICNHSTITYQDLVVHKDTHDNNKVFECDKCDYKCRSKWAYEKHVSQKHLNNWGPKYGCHCCDKLFTRGALLTKHLIKVHDFHWPSGHSRFLYKRDVKTGIHYLKVVRYESLEVTQEMIQGNAACQEAVTQNYKIECEQSKMEPYSYVLKIADKKEEDDETCDDTQHGKDTKIIKYEMVEYESDDTDNLVINDNDL